MGTEQQGLSRHAEAMLRLARMDKSNLQEALHEITSTVSDVLDVERVGVWMFDERGTAFRCIDLYIRGEDRHEAGAELSTDAYPAYFRALAESRTIEAEDAQHDTRTKELTESYLRPHGITSMLDVPCWRGGRVAGIVCHEHVGGVRQWRSEDRAFASSIADMIALALEADERRKIAEQREQLLEQLGRERQLLEQVLQQMPAGVVLVDPDGELILRNERADQMLGPTMPPELIAWSARAVRGGERISGEEVGVTGPDGAEMWLSINCGSVRDEVGGVVAAVTAFVDSTERRIIARELEEEGQFREQFMAVLGHDLRTPATAVSLSAQILRRTELNDQQAGLVDRIVSSMRRMDRMIGELLDLARIRGGRIPLAPKALDLREVYDDVLAELQVAWPARTITVDIEGDVRGRWDEGRLAQVLSNLLGNALAHGSADHPVQVRMRGEPNEVEIEVHNVGAPIPEDLMNHLFEPFRGVQPENKGPHAGLGLGLFITHAVVEAHAGRITARSDPHGTTFTVRLPRRAVVDPGAEPA